MDLITGFGGYFVPFILVLSVLVFVHEFGHFWVARRCGVKVEVFSIGFGPELFGRYDRTGTRWKVSAIPLGGYVKMFGDADVASARPADVSGLNAVDLSGSFHTKRLWQRAAIVAAGPIANFLFAILVFAGLFIAYGQPYTPPDIGGVEENSPAAVAGLRPGDVIRSIDGRRVSRFEEIQQQVRMNADRTLTLEVERDGRMQEIQVTPQLRVEPDRFGNVHKFGRLGIARTGVEYKTHNPLSALRAAMAETWNVTTTTLGYLRDIILGLRGTEELGGPLRIAQVSGQAAQVGVVAVITLAALLSINLGLINLFPVPLLDGGHLLFYAIEAVRGRPLGERAQEYGLRLGFALVLTLMAFATWNDLVQLSVVQFIRDLVF
ncbi:MAG TPA: RIP metalloprotease RseP [Azospirillaceae bacterium]|nr:RIP metalloprotease RseP [Azospirillaceae bacterium]